MGHQPASLTLMTGGCFILFCDWLFFNAGSAGTITQDRHSSNLVELSIMNTIISAVGAVTAISGYNMFQVDSTRQSQNVTLKFDLTSFIGACMSGCVAVTASCNNVTFASAFVIGFVSAIIYTATTNMFEKLEIDDPL